MNRYLDWMRQAENDLRWAEHTLAGGFFSQTCFIAQQAGEKTLKAYCFFKGFDIVRTHSIFQIVRQLGENGELEKFARELDIYYVSARYPDAFPDGAPFEIITSDQAERALTASRQIFDIVRRRLADPLRS
jgi:HEPN domain-containing protein